MRTPLAYDEIFPDARFFAVVSFAAGVLTLAAVVLSGPPPTTEPVDLLEWFRSHRARYLVSACVVLAWMLVSLPFVSVMQGLLGQGRQALARSAAWLAGGGLLLLGFGSFIGIGSFFALDDASRGIAARLQAPYQAAIWRNLGFLLSDPGLMLLGGGQFLFAWLAVRTMLSRVIVVIGFVGGVAGLLTLAVYQTPLLAVAQLVAFAVWAVAIGVLLLRRRSEASAI